MRKNRKMAACTNNIKIFFLVMVAAGIFPGCEKLIEIPEPTYSITSAKVFSNDKQATSAMAGVYTDLANGNASTNFNTFNGPADNFACGLSTLAGGLSSDEFIVVDASNAYTTNKLTAISQYSKPIWQTAYTAIYGCNAILEGIAASESNKLTDSTRKQLNGEAKFVRAFSYFYLVNFFGDVPLALTTNFNQTSRMARTPKETVYKQIIQDLKEAKELLPGDYKVSGGERVRPNKWAAAAMLARTYLYTKDYPNAFIQAGDVIANSSQFSLEEDLNEVFLTNSREAIWQLQQNTNVSNRGNGTAEGVGVIPSPFGTGMVSYMISSGLLNSFEFSDQRKQAWIGVSDQVNELGQQLGIAYFPYKYKTGLHNYAPGSAATEYYMVLRLAEQYLIRAEAQANGSGGGTTAAIGDLNTLRKRADLTDLPDELSQPQLMEAIEKEWRLEFFCEWGHRWFNLNRTGRASQVLSAIPYKQPWWGDYQLLYPIPPEEIVNDNNLRQNLGY